MSGIARLLTKHPPIPITPKTPPEDYATDVLYHTFDRGRAQITRKKTLPIVHDASDKERLILVFHRHIKACKPTALALKDDEMLWKASGILGGNLRETWETLVTKIPRSKLSK